MTKGTWTFTAALLAGCGTPTPSPAPLHPDSPLLLTGVTVVDPSHGAPSRPDQAILIAGGKIVAVGPRSSVHASPGTPVLDGRGKFVVPGLWDMHVHFMNTGSSALALLLVHGVTSVREMGGFLDSTRSWQARMASGTLLGPRIKTPGPILESPRYLAGVRSRDSAAGGLLAPRVLPYRIGVADSAVAERTIDSLVRLRVDFVKIRTTASRGAYLGILASARRAGLPVAGHQPQWMSVADAAEAGQLDIEHGLNPPTSGLGAAERRDLYRRLAAAGAWYTPTLVVSGAVQVSGDSGLRLLFGAGADRATREQRYASHWLLGWWRMQLEERVRDTSTAQAEAVRLGYASSVQDVRGMRDAGVRLLAGTDAGSVLVYPGFSLHEELRLLVEDAGLSPREALAAATISPARYFGMEKELGSIAPGQIADLVLLDADPLENIRNTTRIFAVVQAGRLFDRERLDSLLNGALRPPK